MSEGQVHLNIPVARFQNVLSWDAATINHLVGKAIDVAARVGLRLDDDAKGVYLEEVERKGAKINRDERTVLFTEEDIQGTIAVMRQTQPVPDPLRPRAVCEQGREQRFGVGNGANLFFDWDAWQAMHRCVCETE